MQKKAPSAIEELYLRSKDKATTNVARRALLNACLSHLGDHFGQFVFIVTRVDKDHYVGTCSAFEELSVTGKRIDDVEIELKDRVVEVLVTLLSNRSVVLREEREGKNPHDQEVPFKLQWLMSKVLRKEEASVQEYKKSLRKAGLTVGRGEVSLVVVHH
jgi:hypothetical protein